MSPLQTIIQGNFLNTGGQVPLTVSILLILFGFMFCFTGYRLLKVVLFITGAIIGGALMTLVWSGIFPMILGALIGGFVSMGLYIVGIFILGAIFGAVITKLFFLPMGMMAPDLLTVIVAVLGGIFATWFQRPLVIIASGIYGAGMIVHGFDTMLSGASIFVPLRSFDFSTFTAVHLILAFALTVAGIIVQFSTSSEPERQVPQPEGEKSEVEKQNGSG